LLGVEECYNIGMIRHAAFYIVITEFYIMLKAGLLNHVPPNK
jgi:hypothetical protein